ncbi:MAG: OmpA family protein [Bacteroidota bacterium]
MKPFIFFARVGFLLLLILRPAAGAHVKQINFDEFPNYVVIGAFAIHQNAVKFATLASRQHLNAKFEMNPNRNLYYVYVLHTDDHLEAVGEAIRLRNETDYEDTWVYHGLLGKMARSNQARGIKGVDINPVTTKKIQHVEAEDQDQVKTNVFEGSVTTEKKSSAKETRPTEDAQKTDVLTETKTDNVQKIDATAESKKLSTADEINGKNFFFKIFRAIDNESIQGEVDVIDTEKSRKVGTYQGNASVKVSSPGNKTGDVSLVCEVFGYRKAQQSLNYNDPAGANFPADENGNITVPFELVRLQKGDIAVMYNVYFFKDAAVMRPESRFEVNSLLEMLKENEKYKIKIHGHTNGGAHGKIISIGKNSENFFSLTDTKEGFGSAKKLSEERASVIRDYLLSNGIPHHRMHIKAWGGKRPIHDKHSTRAQENVRVEIEILEDK